MSSSRSLPLPTWIACKRDGGELSDDALREIVAGAARGTVPDYQIAALLMAIVWRGLSPRELATWLDAMVDSGDRLRLDRITGIKVDKHSTGGVGDKISLCLAPLVAACGVPVPMMSGRSLGHTGGTLDKLEAIPGFRTALTPREFEHVLQKAGLVLAGQSARLAPADRCNRTRRHRDCWRQWASGDVGLAGRRSRHRHPALGRQQGCGATYAH